MKTMLQTRFKFSTLAVIAATIISLCSSANSAEDREAPANLALRKNARQSSTSFGGDAGRAVDGDTNGRYSGNSVSHTAEERESWWEVDLGRVEDIAELRIWNRTDEHGDRLVNFVLLISERPFAGSSLAALLKEPGVWNGSHPGTAGEKTVITANTRGRFVRVQLRQKNFLALAEVQVMGAAAKAAVAFGPGAGGQNLALKKSVRQSSTGFGGDAQRAVDGDTNGDFTRGSVSHTTQEKEPWWEVDLGRMEDIAEIRLWNRTDQHAARLANFYVFVSEWPFFSNSLEAARQIPAIWNSFHPGAVATSDTIKVGAKGRFVRVQLRDNNFLSLAEVEVMGAGRAAEANPPAQPLPPAPVAVAPPLPPPPAPAVVYAPVAPVAPTQVVRAEPVADAKRELGLDPIKKLGESDAQEQELARARLAQEQALAQARQEREKAEAERKLAAASAAEAAKQEAARQEAARQEVVRQEAAQKLAEQKAAEAAEAVRIAKQKAESEAIRVKIPEAVADSKWDGTAEYACAEFWVYLAAPVQFDSVGHARPADDWNKTVGETMELKYADKEKQSGECFQIRGRSFEHEFKRERDWYGATGTYRVAGTLNPDMTMITSLTVSYRVDPIRVKNSEGNMEREKDKRWTATITNIPRTNDNNGNEFSFALKMDTEKLQLPQGSAVSQSEFVETDTYYVYSTVRASDDRKTLTETIKTNAGPWKINQPGSNVDIDIAIKKRKGR